MSPPELEDSSLGTAAAPQPTSGAQRLPQQMAQLGAAVVHRPTPLHQLNGATLTSETPKMNIQGDVRLIIAGYLRENQQADDGLSIISQPIVIEGEQASSEQQLAAASEPRSSISSQISAYSDGLNTNGPPQTQHGGLQQQPPPPPPQSASQRQWQMMLLAARQGNQVRQRVSMAGDQLGASLRQLYASASSIAADLPPPYHNIPGIVPYYHGRSSGPPPSYDDVVNPYAPPPSYQSLFGQMLEARKRSRGFLDLLRRLLIISTLGCTILIAFMILVPFTMIIIGAIYLDECKIEHIPAFLLVGGLIWASKNIIHCYAQCQPDFGDQQRHSSESNDSAELQVNVSSANNGTTLNGIASEQANVNSSSLAESIHGTGGDIATVILEQQQQQQEALHSQQATRRRRLKSSICESLLNCILLGWFIAGCVIVFRNYEPDFENPSSARYCNRTVYMYTFWLITTAIMLVGLFIGCICCLMVSSAIASRQDDDLS